MRTEIVFILDASGSMTGLEADTIGGFNSLIEKNREEPGEAVVSTVLFSSDSRVLHDRLDIREVPRLTRRDYECYGCTALLDAVGGAIRHVDLVQKVQPQATRRTGCFSSSPPTARRTRAVATRTRRSRV